MTCSPIGASPAIGTSHRLAEPKSLSREDIARIIDPEAWDEYFSDAYRALAEAAKELALSKADTILVGWGLEEDSSISQSAATGDPIAPAAGEAEPSGREVAATYHMAAEYRSAAKAGRPCELPVEVVEAVLGEIHRHRAPSASGGVS